MADINGLNSWNFTVEINGNYSCEECSISGLCAIIIPFSSNNAKKSYVYSGGASMNSDFMDFTPSTDVAYDYNATRGYYWMNMSVNGTNGLYNAEINGGKRDFVFIECNNDSSCSNVNWYLNAYSVGDIDCDEDKESTCTDGKYYCRDYVVDERECIDNGVIFTCDHTNLECDIAFDIFYPTSNPTKQPTVPTMDNENTQDVGESNANINAIGVVWCLFCFIIYSLC